MKKLLFIIIIVFLFSCEKPKYVDNCYECYCHKWGVSPDSTYILCDMSNEDISRHIWSVGREEGYIKCERMLSEPFVK